MPFANRLSQEGNDKVTSLTNISKCFKTIAVFKYPHKDSLTFVFPIAYGHHGWASGGLPAALSLNGRLYKNKPNRHQSSATKWKKRWSPLTIKMPKLWRSKTTESYSPHKEIFQYGRQFTPVSACSMNLDQNMTQFKNLQGKSENEQTEQPYNFFEVAAMSSLPFLHLLFNLLSLVMLFMNS